MFFFFFAFLFIEIFQFHVFDLLIQVDCRVCLKFFFLIFLFFDIFLKIYILKLVCNKFLDRI